MKPLIQIALIFSLFFIIVTGAFAKPPTLEPASEFPASIIQGHPYEFRLKYKQSEGDPPSKPKMVIDAPYGQETRPIEAPGGDPALSEGVPLVWNFSPSQSGQYQYHFEVTSTTGDFARYPKDNELSFETPNPIVKYIILAVGLVIALFFLPFVVYMLARAANKRSDPAAAARVALMIGILSFCGLAWYLFLQNEETRVLGIIIEVLAVGAFLVVMITRRRAV